MYTVLTVVVQTPLSREKERKSSDKRSVFTSNQLQSLPTYSYHL